MAGEDHRALSETPGVEPLRYEPDQPPSKSYLVLPDAMLSDRDTLRSWIERSAAGLKPAAGKARKREGKGR
jgi:TfoX/Sxy family transcriptional regulator of competence genes